MTNRFISGKFLFYLFDRITRLYIISIINGYTGKYGDHFAVTNKWVGFQKFTFRSLDGNLE